MLRTKRAVQALYAEDSMKRPETMLAIAQQRLESSAPSQSTPMDQLENNLIQSTQAQSANELSSLSLKENVHLPSVS